MQSSSSALAVRTAAEMLYRGREDELDRQYPRMLVLLTQYWIGMEEGLAAVRQLAGMKLRLQLYVDPALRQVLGRREIAQVTGVDDFLGPDADFRDAGGNTGMEPPLASNIQYLFIPVLSFSLMSRISRLDDESPVVRLILQGLCSGRKVAALRAGVEDGGPEWTTRGCSMPPAIRREAADMLGSLRSYGVTLLGSERIDEWIAGSRGKKELIAGDDILSAVSEGVSELKTGRGSIITPLARDLAAQYGIQILQAQDGETM